MNANPTTVTIEYLKPNQYITIGFKCDPDPDPEPESDTESEISSDATGDQIEYYKLEQARLYAAGATGETIQCQPGVPIDVTTDTRKEFPS